jgi:hypothetical protein
MPSVIEELMWRTPLDAGDAVLDYLGDLRLKLGGRSPELRNGNRRSRGRRTD